MASPQPAHNVPAALLMLKQGHVTKVTGTHHPEKKLGLLSAFTRSQMIASTELCSTAFHPWPPAASWGRRRVVRGPCSPPGRDRPQSVAGVACAVPGGCLSSTDISNAGQLTAFTVNHMDKL